jgi:CDP-glucose 4,6-dehydratase
MDYPLGHRLRELPGPLLLTGHTGFKGAWMTFLLEHLNVSVVGYSLPPEKDSLYERADRTGAIPEVFADIRDYRALEEFIDVHKPSTIIHMAAQPLVLKSYKNPRETFDVNVMGTVNLLDIAFKRDFVKAIIVVTTDKVYRNDNSGRAFIETDPLEGKDPYSASKVGTEAVVAAWQQIAKVSGGPKVTSVRAGNVIGGGDFAENRIIPDLIRSVLTGKSTEIRNPISTRPWQHVLDPCVGYIITTEKLIDGGTMESLNFGPEVSSYSVQHVANIGKSAIPEISYQIFSSENTQNSLEAASLNLCSILSLRELNWSPKWDSEKACQTTFNWWKKLLTGRFESEQLCINDIINYFDDRNTSSSYKKNLNEDQNK